MLKGYHKVPIVAIQWRDAVTRAHVDWGREWTRELSICLDIGALVYEDEEKVVLVNHSAPSGDCDLTVIPKSCIVERKELKGFRVEVEDANNK